MNLKWMMKKTDFYTLPANIRHTVNHFVVINVTLCVFGMIFTIISLL